MSEEKQAVALGSIIASGLMTVAKFTVGFLTGSLGLISEGAHSLMDLGATVMTYMAVRVSDKPADSRHPYGHGKVESVAALAETGLLFVTSAWIIYEAIRRLTSPEVEVEATWWSVGVIVVSIAIDFFRARALSRVAKETNSQALEADALHFSSDILSSAVVLVGLGLVWLGYPLGDPIAAIGVALFVCLAGYRLGRRTIDTLTDAAPDGAAERIASIIERVSGIAAIERVRVRPGGTVLFVDLDVLVSRTLPLDRVTAIKAHTVEAIRKEIPEAEIGITAHPLALDDETIIERVMISAANCRVAIHHVTVQHLGERLSVSLDLEVDGTLPMLAAHETATRLETAICEELGHEVEVETHIEPMHIDGMSGADVEPELLASMGKQIADLAVSDDLLQDVHDLRIRRTDAGLVVNYHCHVAPDRTVTQVHDAVDDLERRIRQQWPEVCRVVGHAEPARSSRPAAVAAA